MSLKHISYNNENSEKLVVLLHGYGSDGNDLIRLAPYWESVLPKTDFLAPHAPFPCDEDSSGQQWFSLKDRNPDAFKNGLKYTPLLAESLPLLNEFLDQALEARGLCDQDLCLVGFSQGTMVALSCALQRPAACAGVLGYSGAFFSEHPQATATPPVFLIHGDEDPVVPFEAMEHGETLLKTHGIQVQTHARPRLGHGIDEKGLHLGGDFLRKCLQR